MFEGPEHASYIELCRALRLEREWQEGDWHVSLAGYVSPTLPGTPMLVTAVELRLRALVEPERLADSIWLPRLDQLLMKLEETGFEETTIQRYVERGKAMWWAGEKTCTDSGTDWSPMNPGGPTPEEACCRLRMAVTGREAPR